MAKTIEVTQGMVAIVDDEDYPELSKYKWYANKREKTCYADRLNSNGKLVRMQNHIMKPPPGFVVDHKDRNGLNNQRSNLRLATPKQNSANRSPATQSGYKGVDWQARDKAWRAKINVDGVSKSLGYYKNAEDAARAYDRAAKKHFGEFAYLNFPDD